MYHCVHFIVSRDTKCTNVRFDFFFLLIFIMDTMEQGKYIFRSLKNVFILYFYFENIQFFNTVDAAYKTHLKTCTK